MKQPVIIHLRNAQPLFMDVEICGDHLSPEEFDAEVIPQLPHYIHRLDVVSIKCFCPACQVILSHRMGCLFSALEQAIEGIPVDLILKVLPCRDKDESPLTDAWEYQQHLFQALKAAQPHLVVAREAAEKWMEVNRA